MSDCLRMKRIPYCAERDFSCLCVCIRDPFLLGLDAFVKCLTEFCIPQELPGAWAQLPKVLSGVAKKAVKSKRKNLEKKTKTCTKRQKEHESQI